MLTEIDLTHLAKGDYLSATTISEAMNLNPATDEYDFALMALRIRIEAHFELTTGKKVTVKCEGKGIRVLTDSEASEYNAHQIELQRSRMGRTHRRNLDVNEAALKPEELQVHYRNLQVGGAYLQAMRKVKRAIPLTPHVRQTPSH